MRSRHAQFQPCHLEQDVLEGAVGWIEQNRRIWSDRFDRLDDHLTRIQEATDD